MYKLTKHLSNKQLILVRRRAEPGPCTLLVLHRPELQKHYATAERPKCPPPEQIPPKRLGKLFWGTVGATLLTGSAVVYAKQNPDIRDWLSINAPWADDFVAVVYQENQNYGQWAGNQWTSLTAVLSDFFFGKEGVIPDKKLMKADQDLSKDVKWGKQDYNLPKPALAPHYVEEKKEVVPPEVDSATVIKTDPVFKTEKTGAPLTRDILEIEKSLFECTKQAIDNYDAATKACADYNKSINKMVEASVEELDRGMFDRLHTVLKAREEAVSQAKDAAVCAEKNIEDMRILLEGGLQAPQDAITATRRHLDKFRCDVEVARKRFECEMDQAYISDKYWKKVEAARTAYLEQLQVLFPGLDVCARKLDFSKGDPDILLEYTLRQVLFLQQQLIENQTVQEARLKRAIESHKDKELINKKVADMLKYEKVRLESEYQKKVVEVRAKMDRDLKCQIKKQLELHQEVLHEKICAKEAQVMGKLNLVVSEKVEVERVLFKKQLAEVSAKMRAIEATLKARAAADEQSRRSQALWAAGESLLAATRRCVDQIRVDKEITAIEKAAGDKDKLVCTVMKGIPKEVREKGIVTETALRDKYFKMEKTALRVALVSKDGAPLPIYFLSWLQSLLLFSKVSEIPRKELEDQPMDFTGLDTFDIMQRARYWIERNNLAAALKYVNLLEGASRAAANSWSEAVRHHLETKQAAEAVMAHAAACGLQNL